MNLGNNLETTFSYPYSVRGGSYDEVGSNVPVSLFNKSFKNEKFKKDLFF